VYSGCRSTLGSVARRTVSSSSIAARWASACSMAASSCSVTYSPTSSSLAPIGEGAAAAAFSCVTCGKQGGSVPVLHTRTRACTQPARKHIHPPAVRACASISHVQVLAQTRRAVKWRNAPGPTRIA
jgi:hypothetical protein